VPFPFVPVTVTITRFIEIQRPDTGSNVGDYYGKIKIGGSLVTTNEIIGTGFNPNWEHRLKVDPCKPVPIVIEIFDGEGGASADDVIDISPNDRDTNLNLLFNIQSGTWSGDIPGNENSARGDGDTGRERPAEFTQGGEIGEVHFNVAARTAVYCEVLRETDLEITKSTSPDPVIAGGELTYTLNVRNNGPLPAGNVRVTDKLPEGISFVNGTVRGSEPIARFCGQFPEGTLICDFGELATGDSIEIVITARTSSGLVPAPNSSITITNEATVENLGSVCKP
jgi:uncharacterized repeat protein (TIGR01451 family)